jgi:hypothetical protein
MFWLGSVHWMDIWVRMILILHFDFIVNFNVLWWDFKIEQYLWDWDLCLNAFHQIL